MAPRPERKTLTQRGKEGALGSPAWRATFSLVTAGLLVAFAGCTVGPDFVRPEPPAVSRYTAAPEPTAVAADSEPQRFRNEGEVPRRWWGMFGSAKIDAAVNEAQAGNQTLAAAEATLRQSQELLRAGYGIFAPQVDASFDATRQRLSPARFGVGGNGSVFTLFTLSASVSYVLDLFGGERRTVEGLQAQVELQRAQVRGADLTLSANVVNAMIARAAYQEEIAATNRIIERMREQLGVVEAQVSAGTASYASLLGIRSQLAAIEATLPPLQLKFDQTGHLLALLVGRAPEQWTPPPIALSELTLPREVPVTLPSELVRKRPDILAAEGALHAAGSAVGVATAALFPTFTLSGSAGTSGGSMEGMFRGGSGIWSIGADVTTPIFHGGTLWFQRKAAQESYRQALASYRQVVLSAFAQVADVLRALEHDAESVQAQARACRSAEEEVGIVEAGYRAGVSDYLQLLVADQQYQQARIGWLQAKAQRLQDTVALFLALGGGWGAEPGTETERKTP